MEKLGRFNLVFGKILNLFLQIINAIGPIINVDNGQILSKLKSHLVTLIAAQLIV